MVCGGLWVFVVVCGGLWWSVVVCEGLWSSVGFCGGLWWSVVVCGGLLQKKNQKVMMLKSVREELLSHFSYFRMRITNRWWYSSSFTITDTYTLVGRVHCPLAMTSKALPYISRVLFNLISKLFSHTYMHQTYLPWG